MKFSFEIPGKLPGLNDIIGAARAHWSISAKQKLEHTEGCGMAIVSNRVPYFNKKVFVTFDWIEPNNRRDIDNIAAGSKFILDALVDTGRLKNDGRKWVSGIFHNFPSPNSQNPRVRITIEEVE